jgi:hypothetical protein
MPTPTDIEALFDDPEAIVELAALLGVVTREEVEQLIGEPKIDTALNGTNRRGSD